MRKAKRKILVIDDEPDLASTLAVIFQSHSYETATAFSGEEAIEVASTFEPDCIVSDVIMGAMNGIQSAMKILKGLPDCKVLFISGNAAYKDLVGRDLLINARASGFDFEVMQKPVHPRDLLARVYELLK